MALKPPGGSNNPLLQYAPIVATSYGVYGNGINDDTLALSAALTAAAGRTLKLTKGTYKVTSGLTLTSDVTLDMTDGATINFSTAPTSTVLFTATGSEGSTIALTANAAAGATNLSVSAGQEAGFAAGDVVRVGSTLQYDPGRTNTPIGELAIVLSTSSGTINLRSPLVGPLTYNTSDTAVVSEITPVRHINVIGGAIIGGGTGSTHQGFKFDKCFGVRVTDVQFDNVENVSVQAFDSIDVLVDGIHVERSNRSGTGYGVEISYASQDCSVVNSYFRDVRHGTTTGSGTSRKGFPRRIAFVNNRVVDSTDVGMDNHGAGDDMTFIGNTIVDSGSAGMNVNCPGAVVQGNTVIRAAAQGILMRNFANGATDYIVTGNRVVSPTGVGIAVFSSALGTGATTDGIKVTQNHVRDGAAQGIQIVSLDTFRLDTIDCSHNKVNNCAFTAIQVQKADNATVVGNICKQVPTAQTALWISDITESSVTGNVIKFASLSSGTGILGTGTVDVTFSSNVVKLAGTGISLTSAATTCTLVGNNSRSCTTPISWSTGTGHVGSGNLPGVVSTVASAATVTLPGSENDVFKISGTTTIDTITATAMAGRRVSLIFTSTANLGDGTGNLKLTGTITPTADDVVELRCDGTSWFQAAPIAVN